MYVCLSLFTLCIGAGLKTKQKEILRYIFYFLYFIEKHK